MTTFTVNPPHDSPTLQAAIVTTVTDGLNQIINGAPSTLDTLKEIADAIGDDPNYSGTITSALAGKATPADVDAKIAAQAASDSATYAILGRRKYELYDEFSAVTNSVLANRAPAFGGLTWKTTGTTLPYVDTARHVLTNDNTGYAYTVLSGKPTGIACDVVWSATTVPATPGQNMTMAFTGGTTDIDLTNLAAHFNFGPLGFTLTVRKDGGTFDGILSGSWARPCQVDGTSSYRFGMRRNGSTIIIDGPNGELFAVTDARVAALIGNVVFWEPVTFQDGSGYRSSLTAVGAYTAASAGRYAFADFPGESAAEGHLIGPNRTTLGAPRTAYEVGIGFDPGSNLPGIMFGPNSSILATLTQAASVGATTLLVDQHIPTGSTIQIESGTNSETVTVSTGSTGASPGSVGTYTITVPALTKAHAAGVAVSATVPASWKARMYVNGGGLNIPGGLNVGAGSTGLLMGSGPGGTGLFFGNAYDIGLFRKAAGVLGMASGQVFRHSSAATASRPSAATAGAGAEFYDTTLSKPIWSDGTVWRDATGTGV